MKKILNILIFLVLIATLTGCVPDETKEYITDLENKIEELESIPPTVCACAGDEVFVEVQVCPLETYDNIANLEELILNYEKSISTLVKTSAIYDSELKTIKLTIDNNTLSVIGTEYMFALELQSPQSKPDTPIWDEVGDIGIFVLKSVPIDFGSSKTINYDLKTIGLEELTLNANYRITTWIDFGDGSIPVHSEFTVLE